MDLLLIGLAFFVAAFAVWEYTHPQGKINKLEDNNKINDVKLVQIQQHDDDENIIMAWLDLAPARKIEPLQKEEKKHDDEDYYGRYTARNIANSLTNRQSYQNYYDNSSYGSSSCSSNNDSSDYSSSSSDYSSSSSDCGGGWSSDD
jgi:hypothetical protein